MSARNPATALAEVLVDELVRGGLHHALVAPGSRSTPLALALHAHPQIRLHVELDERSAAFCALGIGRATGRPAAVLSTSGTAAVNFHPAVVEADAARVPLLVLTADRPPELRETGANQTIDQTRLYGGAARWSGELGVAERRDGAARYWRSVAARALAVTVGAPVGPVHLNVAFREPLVPSGSDWPEPLAGRSSGRAWTERAAEPRSASLTDLRWLSERLRAVRRGVVVLGDGVRDAAPLRRLAETFGWPLLAEPQSGGRCGEHAISTYD
ncbi:MAG: 2-succinyl-5-enolpyruvyl-6-hydroxy-3-cyclohexene-1-carboxylic-acid synthase, partial [Egibacteraceae bacterium]